MTNPTPTLVLAITLALGAVVAPPAAAAQARPSLERTEELTRLGRPDEARDILMAWWGQESDDASRADLQRGLWLRARLTVDPVQAELDYRRLVVLYPRGEYTQEALLRLAQGAFETGDEQGARDYVATLSRDFRGSAVTRRAEAWLRDAGPPPAPPEAAARPSTRPSAEVPTQGRPPAAGAERSTTPAGRPPATPEPGGVADRNAAADRGADSPPMEPSGNYFVQLGAFAEEERAMGLFEEMRDAGIDVRVVRVDGSRFLHVRFGRFVQREDAVAELERLAASGINAALVRDERPEQLIRGG